ncbi:MAG TPA: hypothetical protein GXX75_10755 [Clostridiales bacterium]|nr:hypothetical protein [Clostridiales bacterium]
MFKQKWITISKNGQMTSKKINDIIQLAQMEKGKEGAFEDFISQNVD